ncbi:MAG: AAA family ATPase, partial [Eubacteriales bacterium]
MYLKRIELNGFKSFNNKKEFIIKNGITGIVGPNGSGKSNVADAIRWVLGEQSSKNLRGTRMEDVMVNGSQELAKKGFCEVALVFDNADMRIVSEYTEICIRRKMYRSGESEYYINATACRLKDILDLFRDTGIGKEGYSISGQGKIDEILNSKATARRKVFEEAAGIMKYRVRKEEAEHNLEKTR